MLSRLFPVILCGGSGTRLWPLSRTSLPKQFIKFAKQSLFEDTLDRVSTLSENSIVVCGNTHRFLVASMMSEKKLDLQKNSILLEPMPKNTALAIALAAFKAIDQNKNAILLVMPSDHVIEPVEMFVEKTKEVISFTKENIITFGITPDSAHTGYGYIVNGEEVSDSLYKVGAFTEKPNKKKAKELLEKNASWNSGMFLMKASLYLNELKKYREDIYNASLDVWNSRHSDLDFTRFAEEVFAATPAESIDFAVMEKTQKALVCPLDVKWSDLGGFEAFHENEEKDAQNNCVIGDVILHETTNSYVHATSSLLAIQGMDNVAVVQTKDAILVSPLDKTQEIKSLINLLNKEKRVELEEHSVYYRPWGQYETLIKSDRFQVQHVLVKPGGALSTRLHHHISGHWVIVKGTALVMINDNEQILTENQSVYIPLGSVHTLSNPGHIPLEVIEVQTGSYLGEDDIKRIESIYDMK